MSKGAIISHAGEGLYSVKIIRDMAAILGRISAIDKRLEALEASLTSAEAELSSLQAQYAANPSIENLTAMNTVELRVNTLRINIANLEKEKERFEGISVQEEQTAPVWCADYSLELAGDNIAIANVPGEENMPGRAAKYNIRPGYSDSAAYSGERDGVLRPSAGMNIYQVYLAASLTAAVRKWKPQYRYGEITAIDYESDTCEITLEESESRYLTGGPFDINQTSTLSDVPVEYMECHADAFETGDVVLIEFQEHNWNQPRVIGFKSNPKPCRKEYVYVLATDTEAGGKLCFIWDPEIDAIAVDIPLDIGGYASFPIDPEEISGWVEDTFLEGGQLYGYTEQGIDELTYYYTVSLSCGGDCEGGGSVSDGGSTEIADGFDLIEAVSTTVTCDRDDEACIGGGYICYETSSSSVERDWELFKRRVFNSEQNEFWGMPGNSVDVWPTSIRCRPHGSIADDVYFRTQYVNESGQESESLTPNEPTGWECWPYVPGGSASRTDNRYYTIYSPLGGAEMAAVAFERSFVSEGYNGGWVGDDHRLRDTVFRASGWYGKKTIAQIFTINMMSVTTGPIYSEDVPFTVHATCGQFFNEDGAGIAEGTDPTTQERNLDFEAAMTELHEAMGAAMPEPDAGRLIRYDLDVQIALGKFQVVP